MRKILQKYNEALKVPQEIYDELHKEFLVPLDLWIDGEQEFKNNSDLFYIWGDNRPELKTRKGMALVNLDGKNDPEDISIGPLDHHNIKYDEGLVDECYLECHFTQPTPQLDDACKELKQFDLGRSSILWWQAGDNFVPHVDVRLPTVNLRLWGCTDSGNIRLRSGPNPNDLVKASYESKRLYLIDTSIIHDAYAYDEVYQYFIALLPTENNYNLLRNSIDI
jgi:hypothetical protein